ncbi:hypothetical protein DRQ09_10745 [candidate division KSB1 bacterium]|nr:MAG: hypothetical protein DRQ09_10745 [candidate division KSB1 bacterium]
METSFKFFTETGVIIATNIIADSLLSFLNGLKKVSGSSIFFHLHHSLLRRHFTTSDFMNDFARWVWLNLGQPSLAEKLASVDPLYFRSIREARQKMIDIVQGYVGEGEFVYRVPKGKEFNFLELKSFVIPTGFEANDLKSFLKGLKNSSRGTYFYHLIEAPIRIQKPQNDFSEWLSSSLGETELAKEISGINPYTYNLWEIKKLIIDCVKRRLAK